MLTSLTLIAALVRLWALDSIPNGLHGDEAWTGLDARRILDEGWIGPYVGSALGQPTGPLYWTALVLRLLGDGVYQLRLSMALLSVATVPLTYWAASQMFDRRVGLFAAVFMAFMGWVLLFSRTAFLVNAWPLMEVIFIGLLFAAHKHDDLKLYGGAGTVLGLGVYSYNAYPVFVGGVAIYALLQLAQARQRRRLALGFGLLFAVAFFVALPLTGYISDDKNDYFAHHRVISVLESDAFEDASRSGKARILLDRTAAWLEVMVQRPHIDFTDASGTRPVLDQLTVLLLVCGIVVCGSAVRSPPHQFLIVMLLVLPLAAIVTIDGGARRALGLSPIVAMLAALALAWAWEHAERARSEWQAVVRVAVAGALVAFAASNVYVYFAHVGDSSTAHWVYVEELSAAADYMAAQRDKPYVYFFSSRWGYNYETRRYLAPDLSGEDRSKEFSVAQETNLEFDRTGPGLVILLPPYESYLEEIRGLYPGGEVHTGRRGERLLFVAYLLPRRE